MTPFTYDHYSEGESPDPPFICFRYPRSNNFGADGGVYYKITEADVELYTELKDPELEERVEGILDTHGFFYDKSEVWIRCAEVGISIRELDLLTIGMVLDVFTEKGNDSFDYPMIAGQEQFDRF